MPNEQQIQRAFLNGVRGITDQVRLGRMTDALRRGDIQAVLDELDIDDAAFDEFRRVLVQEYTISGIDVMSDIPAAYRTRWNSASPYAETYARTAQGHITEITTQMRRAIQGHIADGIALGRPASRVALDIAGRIGADGRRHGGLIGLNDPQRLWVESMRVKLTGIPDWPSIQLNGKRDFRFDRTIKKAWETGTSLTQSQIDNILGRYSDILLLSRAKTIARTERGYAVNAAAADAWRIAADRAGVPHSAIRKTWKHSQRQMEPRVNHLLASGKSVMGLDTTFAAWGVPLAYPHDPSAAPEHVINCDCTIRYSIPAGWRNG